LTKFRVFAVAADVSGSYCTINVVHFFSGDMGLVEGDHIDHV
jgi:hypothetical protein